MRYIGKAVFVVWSGFLTGIFMDGYIKGYREANR